MSTAGPLLDIAIIPVYNASVLAVADVSSYPVGFHPQNPFLEITPPGFTTRSLSFQAREINIYNAETLELVQDATCNTPLPDGVWKLRFSIRPNFERKVEKMFMRLDQITQRFDTAFLHLQLSAGCCGPEDKQIERLSSIETYLQAAMAAANKCNEKLAFDFYRKADKLLRGLDCSP